MPREGPELMGTWGVESFENDGASDWAYDLESSGNLRFIQETLEAVLKADYVDASLGENGVAASEVVACLRGNPGPMLPDSVSDWVKQRPQDVPGDLVEKALGVLRRVQSPPSELLELWEESAEFASWQAALSSLQHRLSA